MINKKNEAEIFRRILRQDSTLAAAFERVAMLRSPADFRREQAELETLHLRGDKPVRVFIQNGRVVHYLPQPT